MLDLSAYAGSGFPLETLKFHKPMSDVARCQSHSRILELLCMLKSGTLGSSEKRPVATLAVAETFPFPSLSATGAMGQALPRPNFLFINI